MSSFRTELMQALSTVERVEDLETSLVFQQWLANHELVMQSMVRPEDITSLEAINAQYNSQVEHLFNGVLISKKNITKLHQDIVALHASLKQRTENKAACVSVASCVADAVLALMESTERAQRGAYPREHSSYHLLNDPQLLETKARCGTDFPGMYHCAYGGLDALVQFQQTGTLYEIQQAFKQSLTNAENALFFPHDLIAQHTTGLLGSGNTMQFAWIFFPGGRLLTEKLHSGEPLLSDIEHCAAQFDKLNEVGCLHWEAHHLGLVESRGSVTGWKLLGLGKSQKNRTKGRVDAAIFLLEMWQRLQAAERLDAKTQGVLRTLLDKYPLVIEDAGLDRDTLATLQRYREFQRVLTSFWGV